MSTLSVCHDEPGVYVCPAELTFLHMYVRILFMSEFQNLRYFVRIQFFSLGVNVNALKTLILTEFLFCLLLVLRHSSDEPRSGIGLDSKVKVRGTLQITHRWDKWFQRGTLQITALVTCIPNIECSGAMCECLYCSLGPLCSRKPVHSSDTFLT